MPFGRVACLLVLLWAGQAPAAPPANSIKPPEPWGSGPPGDPIKDPESWTFTKRGTWGFVESIGKDGITLYWPAREIVTERLDPMTGEPRGVPKRETFPAIPAKTFMIGEDLAKGGYKKSDTSNYTYRTYRITDVRVGDRVSIEYDRRNGVDICQTICIDRRPKGDVPPAPGERPDSFHKWHELENANQDWEENRAPYPRKYMPSYMGADGKLYVGPFPQQSTRIILIPPEVAPPPRIVPLARD